MSDFDDEFAGQGGSYIADPETGKRTLVERTQEPAAQQPQPAADQPVSE
jgi:hypothetical protein